MTIRTIHLLGSPLLRKACPPIRTVDDTIQRLVDDLFETMRAAKGIGLAANQVGELDRVAVVDIGEDRPLALINPMITSRTGTDVAEEGCLSIPELYGDVKRATSIELEALTREGEPYQLQVDGLEARAIQHEIDHLDGVLFIDHLSLVKRRLLLAKWKRQRKGASGYTQDVTASAEKR